MEQRKKINSILIPHPKEEECSPTPRWQRYFEPEELLGRYEPIRELGRGSYGVIYEGKVLKSWNKLEIGMKVAIKKIRRVFHTEIDAKILLRTLRILHALRKHDNIITLYDIIPPKQPKHFTSLILIFEFVDADLRKIFQTKQYFTELHVKYIVYQILLAIKYMHSAKIAHRDLKPSNILINEDCSVKICDFGLSRGFGQEIYKKNVKQNTEIEHVDDEKTKKQKRKSLLSKKKTSKKVHRSICAHVVYRWYRAPEVILLLQKRETVQSVDMWSIGAIFAELLQMQRENCIDLEKRGALFPGESNFDFQHDPLRGKNQMDAILDVIGNPNESEIAKFTDDRVRKYLWNLPQRKAKNLKIIFAGADDVTLDFLKQFLKFDVDKRIDVDQALQHQYLDEVRDSVLEQYKKSVTFRCLESVNLSQRKWRELILEEVVKYNKYDEDRFMESGAMPNYRKMKRIQAQIIVNGYLRIYIVSLFDDTVIIPIELIAICHCFYNKY